MPNNTDYVLKIDGITGDSVQRGFEGWFTLISYAWGVDGNDGGHPAGLPLVVETPAVKGVPLVEDKALQGSTLPRVELQAVLATTRPSGWIFKAVLTNAKVVSSALGWNAQDGVITRWSLSEYTQAEVSSRFLDARGNWTPISTATWRP